MAEGLPLGRAVGLDDGELRARRLVAAEAEHEQAVVADHQCAIAQHHLGAGIGVADDQAALREMAGELDGEGGWGEEREQEATENPPNNSPLLPLREKVAQP